MNDRYSRQERFFGIGKDGQEKIRRSRVAIIGLGALGTVIAEELTRAGIGFLRLIDRDFVELHNLQRQMLYSICTASIQKCRWRLFRRILIMEMQKAFCRM